MLREPDLMNPLPLGIQALKEMNRHIEELVAAKADMVLIGRAIADREKLFEPAMVYSFGTERPKRSWVDRAFGR